MSIGDLLNKIHKALEDFIQKNPGKKPKIVFNPDTLKFYKSNSPKTNVNGELTTIFGFPFETDEEVEDFVIRTN